MTTLLTLQTLLEGIEYATKAPYFWGSMGFTTATAMYVGAAIYDGQLDQIKKALISVLSYSFLLIWTTFSRLMHTMSLDPSEILHPERPIGNLVALICVTVAWVFGITLGVLVFRLKYGGRHA